MQQVKRAAPKQVKQAAPKKQFSKPKQATTPRPIRQVSRAISPGSGLDQWYGECPLPLHAAAWTKQSALVPTQPSVPRQCAMCAPYASRPENVVKVRHQTSAGYEGEWLTVAELLQAPAARCTCPAACWTPRTSHPT